MVVSLDDYLIDFCFFVVSGRESGWKEINGGVKRREELPFGEVFSKDMNSRSERQKNRELR